MKKNSVVISSQQAGLLSITFVAVLLVASIVHADNAAQLDGDPAVSKKSERSSSPKGGIQRPRLAQSEAGASKEAQSADGQAVWKKELVIEELLGFYDFPEQLISYSLKFPANRVTVEGLRLINANGQNVPIQVTDANTLGGYLREAAIHFRTDLPRESTRRFVLRHDTGYRRTPAQRLTVETFDNGTAVLASQKQRVRVPWGERIFEEGRPASDTPAPLLAIRGRTGNWIGQGSFVAPEEIQALRYETHLEEHGPLFMRYRVEYEFTDDRQYVVRLTLRHGDDHITIDEYLNGFESEDEVYFHFIFDGLDPNARLAMSNVGYNGDGRGQRSGPYIDGVDGDGRLPYELSLYTPNSLGISRSTAFWRDDGDDALLLSINRPEDWQTSQRYIWHSRNKPENIRFYANDESRYMQTQLAGRQRHWAMAAIPRDEMIISKIGKEKGKSWLAQRDMDQAPGGTPVRLGAGPEIRLYQRLTDFSLDRYKEIVFDFEESLEPYETNAESVRFDEFWNEIGLGGGQSSSFNYLVQYYWDWSGGLTHRFGAFSEDAWLAYANNRAKWPEDERRRARASLLFMVEMANSDNFMPHHSMLAGHPNFISEAKFDLALASAIFPNHPKTEEWKNSYQTFMDEWVNEFTREADPSVNARGGRFTENISNYWVTSLKNVGVGALALLAYDGTVVFDDPRFEELLQWTMDGFVPIGALNLRRIVPMGAHSNGRQEIPKVSSILPTLAKTHPELAAQLQWTITNGSKGEHKPRESKLYRDYGAVLWYDHGGENEAMLTVQQLYGRGYRWTPRSNGLLYYAADNQRWSWNDNNTNGDNFDIERLPVFNIKGQSLGAHPIDDLLYNFGQAQFYRARGSHDIYKWRGALMRRDEYLAVYDRVINNQAEGEFQWINQAYGFEIEFFADTELSELRLHAAPPVRSSLQWDWGEQSPTKPVLENPDAAIFEKRRNGEVSPESFSVRWKNVQTWIDEEGTYVFEVDVPEGDEARLWINGEKLIDIPGKGGPQPIELEGGRFADVKVELVHHGGLAYINVRRGRAGGELDTLKGLTGMPKPCIASVKTGPGDQLHIVSPASSQTQVTDYGAIVNGRDHVFFTSEPVSINQANLQFEGQTGLAAENEVYLFEGNAIVFNGFGLMKNGGDFGAGAWCVSPQAIDGRVVGREGGQLTVLLPQPPSGKVGVQVGDESVEAMVDNRRISFPVDITGSDGYKPFSIRWPL